MFSPLIRKELQALQHIYGTFRGCIYLPISVEKGCIYNIINKTMVALSNQAA